MNHRCSRVVLAAIVVIGAGRAARAAEEPDATRRPPGATALRAAGLAGGMGDGVYVGAAADVSRRLSRRLGSELAVAAVGLGGNRMGLMLDALVRGFAFEGVHGLSLAGGPSLFLAENLGPVAFVRAELAYEVRLRRGPSLLVGAGPALALNDSGQSLCNESTLFGCFLDVRHIPAGDLQVRMRAALGYSF